LAPGARAGPPLKVLLITPPVARELGAPLLGLEYVAASLLARGCEGRVIGRRRAATFPHDAAWIVR